MSHNGSLRLLRILKNYVQFGHNGTSSFRSNSNVQCQCMNWFATFRENARVGSRGVILCVYLSFKKLSTQFLNKNITNDNVAMWQCFWYLSPASAAPLGLTTELYNEFQLRFYSDHNFDFGWNYYYYLKRYCFQRKKIHHQQPGLLTQGRMDP